MHGAYQMKLQAITLPDLLNLTDDEFETLVAKTLAQVPQAMHESLAGALVGVRFMTHFKDTASRLGLELALALMVVAYENRNSCAEPQLVNIGAQVKALADMSGDDFCERLDAATNALVPPSVRRNFKAEVLRLMAEDAAKEAAADHE